MLTVNPAAKPEAAAAAADHEVVLLEARLSPRWRTWRFWMCSASCLHLCPLLSPLYLLCGASCRQEEAASFRMTLTAHAINFQQMLYTCGCCCSSVTTKSIPLDKVQDVMLKGDCCGDCCGCSEGNLKPYQLHIQTAGQSGENSAAELSAYCACICARDLPPPHTLFLLFPLTLFALSPPCPSLNSLLALPTSAAAAPRAGVEDAEGFRKAVMGAKRALTVGAAGAGTTMAGADKGGSEGAAQVQMLRVLERIEAAIAEGVTTLRSPQRA